MNHLFDISYLITQYGYWGILCIVFLESGIFFPLPGDSLLFTAGLLAPTIHFSIVLLVFLIFLAAFWGGIMGYYLGTKIERLHRYAIFRKILRKEYIDRAHYFLEHHGLYAMVLSRFIPVVRTFLPIVAGIVKMDYGSFLRYSLVGSFAWSAVFTLSGYFLGKAFPQIENYLLYVIIVVVVISLLPLVFEAMKKRQRNS